MRKIKKKIKNILSLFKKIKKYPFAKNKYIKYYRKLAIKENYILLDSQHGNNINGNIYYILKELNDNKIYENYKLFVVVNANKIVEVKTFLNNKNINKAEVVKLNSKKYFKLLASCKYLFNDTSFFSNFIKKEGQVYTNVWHGTPLKCLGKSTSEGYHEIGNVQKNFLVSDYLLEPNEYMMEHMINDYMLENICKAKVLLAGYPRNTVFFDDGTKSKIRKELGIENKYVMAYMPTYRDNRKQKDEIEFISEMLSKLDKELKNEQILYVNLHPFIGDKIEYNFKHIKKFPKEYETYEFLSVTDCLITDYSSVFFDYANTKNKIILFTYDLEEYFENRGCYISLDELPFPKVDTINALVSEINNNKIPDYTEFLKTYCSFDRISVTKELCEKVILNKTNDIIVKDIKDNKKKNILIYAGSLAKNGLTSSLLNLLNTVDLKENNYILTFSVNSVKNHKKTLKLFNDDVKYISTMGKTNATIFEKMMMYLYFKYNFGKIFLKKIERIYQDDIKRNYGDVKFDSVIQFCGYGAKRTMLYSQFDCNTIIYVHSDMKKEIETRGNQKEHLLKYAYNKYDKVAVVSESLIEKTKYFVDEKKIYLVDNVIDYKTIINKGNKEIKFDDDTVCSIELEELIEILNDKSKIKFINVGRFSFEKGHIRLIDAFNKFWKQNKNSYLIIIGGHGNLYRKTCDYIEELDCSSNIILIKSILNPFPIVKKCNCFVLSSIYEGFGLCLVEADILGLTCFSVDIEGPKKFILSNNGNIVENSEKGIYKGMVDYIEGKLNKMNADYEKYNKNAIDEFLSLFRSMEDEK